MPLVTGLLSLDCCHWTVCHCWCPVTGLRSLLATVMGATSSAYQKRWLECFYLCLLFPCAWPACVQHALARLTLSCTHVYFLCDKLILWPEVQSDSDYSHVHATGPCSACALAQAHPTMSCIQLVLMETEWSNKTCCWEVPGPGPSSLPPWRHNFPYTSHGVYVARLSNVTSRHTSSTHTITA